ncbi:DUF1266 domain-containing protein [Streptomyces caatingaensis]|uniref:DUF1266 domain-containing protein n=1 Tax=Streptomyces caatingaensis TaxID=1678637 RepID=UPI001F521728|nr:DUF1266 domain-containing protein [Streptomyces caatingaensis]
MRNDWAAYFDVLAGAVLYHATPRDFAENRPGYFLRSSSWLPMVSQHCHVYFTEGMLPVPVEDPVFFRFSLSFLARNWPADSDHIWLAINPGSPCEGIFPATPSHRLVWQQHTQKRDPYSSAPTLRTLWVGGALSGPVAHGLACGALLCVHNSSFWNAMAWHGRGFDEERERLKEWWDITDRDGWRRAQENLLQGNSVTGGVWEFVLEIRQMLHRQYGGFVDTAHWRQVTERILRARAQEENDAAGIEAEVTRVLKVIGRITRYEARFRADGLLAEDKQVRSVLAWDFGRASKMARWGLGARYCTLAEAENAVVRAGRISQLNYRSWEEFSAGYILGRCLHFDEEEFGDWYQDMLEAHRILVTEPNSPWLNIPWR